MQRVRGAGGEQLEAVGGGEEVGRRERVSVAQTSESTVMWGAQVWRRPVSTAAKRGVGRIKTEEIHWDWMMDKIKYKFLSWCLGP